MLNLVKTIFYLSEELAMVLMAAPGVADGFVPEADLRVLGSQTLVAYVGDATVFAALVATGVGAEGTAFATPRGIHCVRAKLLAATMDNLAHTGVVPYSYEEVPLERGPPPGAPRLRYACRGISAPALRCPASGFSGSMS